MNSAGIPGVPHRGDLPAGGQAGVELARLLSTVGWGLFTTEKNLGHQNCCPHYSHLAFCSSHAPEGRAKHLGQTCQFCLTVRLVLSSQVAPPLVLIGGMGSTTRLSR